MSNGATYEVLTWDTDLQDFTPQEGMSQFYRGFSGLRQAIRDLREHGYVGRKSDAWSLLYRVDAAASFAELSPVEIGEAGA